MNDNNQFTLCDDRGPQEQVYLCVNYRSSRTLSGTLPRWLALNARIKIYIVDNFSDDEERRRICDLSKQFNCDVIYNDNTGYGAALNIGLEKIKNDYSDEEDVCVFFGNCDITPQNLNEYVEHGKAPELRIRTGRRNSNPFLTKVQLKSLILLKYAAKKQSVMLKIVWSIANKILGMIPSKTGALHGSIMAMNLSTIRTIPYLFHDEIFLYQEELYFSHILSKYKVGIRNSTLSFLHEGSVSTKDAVKSDRSEYFKLWCRSTLTFFDAIEKI